MMTLKTYRKTLAVKLKAVDELIADMNGGHPVNGNGHIELNGHTKRRRMSKKARMKLSAAAKARWARVAALEKAR